MAVLIVPTLLSLALAGSPVASRWQNPLFSLDASVVCALSGGPFVVKATLKYSGPRTIEFVQTCPERGLSPVVVGPRSWTGDFPFARPVMVDGPRETIPDRCRLEPNGTLTEYLRVHRDYDKVPAAMAEMRVIWDVRDARFVVGDGGTDGPAKISSAPTWKVKLQKSVVVNVDLCTHDSLRGVVEHLQELLEPGLVTNEKARLVWAHLNGCPKKEFLPIAIGLLNVDECPSEVVSYIYDRLPNEADSKADAILEYLATKRPTAFASIFRFWEENPTVCPSPKQITELFRNSRNVWVRSLTVARFSEYFPKREVESVARDIATLLRPEPSRQFLALLDDLNSSHYLVRERAEKKITTLGEAGEAMTLRALKNVPSAEVEQRLKIALRDIQALDPAPESFRAIQALQRMTTPEAKELLKVIADGPAGLRSTQEAKKAIARPSGVPSPKQK